MMRWHALWHRYDDMVVPRGTNMIMWTDMLTCQCHVAGKKKFQKKIYAKDMVDILKAQR